MFSFELALLTWLGLSTSIWTQCSHIRGTNALYLLRKLQGMEFIMQETFGHGFDNILPLKNFPCIVMENFGHTYILEDEDLAWDIQLHLTKIAKEGYICAQDVVDYIVTPEVQEHLGTLGNAQTGKISLQTAQRWLKKLRYVKKKNGMYIDGHEREDVVEYRKKFVQRWKEYEKCFVIYDNDSKVVSLLQGFAVPGVRFRLILVTHDELTFYENDRWKTKWVHEKEKAVAEKKGEGQSIMASNFLTVEWRRLTDGDKYVNGCQSLRIRTDKQGFFSSLGRLG